MTVSTESAGALWYPGLSRYIEAMEAWFKARQQWAYDHAVLPDGRRRLCLGALVYGAHVDCFLDYCVPSLLAPGNIAALDDPLIVLHTDAASIDRLVAGLGPLSEHARIEIETIPADILEKTNEHPANKYWLLSCCNNMHMQRAKYRSHDYHMLMPDHFYAAGYFANLDRLAGEGKHAIVQGAISADLSQIGPALKLVGCRVPPDRLTVAALNHLHPQCHRSVMNGGRADYPGGIYFIMVGEDRIEVMSHHMSIAYFSHHVLMRAKLRMFNTVDTQLPWFIPDDIDPYVPSLSDGMTYVELSPPDKAFTPSEGVSLVELCARFWVLTYCTRGYQRFLNLTTQMPLPAGFRPEISPMRDEEIAGLKATIRDAIEEHYDLIVPLVPPELRIDPLSRLELECAGETKVDAREP